MTQVIISVFPAPGEALMFEIVGPTLAAAVETVIEFLAVVPEESVATIEIVCEPLLKLSKL